MNKNIGYREAFYGEHNLHERLFPAFRLMRRKKTLQGRRFRERFVSRRTENESTGGYCLQRNSEKYGYGYENHRCDFGKGI